MDYIDDFNAKTGVKYKIKEVKTEKEGKIHIDVELQGFSENNSGHRFEFVDPIENTFLLDLDKNGYEELYIVTRAAKGNKAAQIHGLSSNVDKSASRIITPDFGFKIKPDHPIYQHFGGHNDIFVRNNEVIETYPINNMYGLDSVRIVKGEVFFELFINGNDWTLSPIRQINHKEQ